MEPGYRVRLSGVEVGTLAVTEHGQPRTVAFTFEPSVDDERFRWARYDSGAFVPFRPPEVGESTELEPVPFDLLSPQP